MNRPEIEIALESLLRSLSYRSYLFGIATILFLSSSWSDLPAATEHVIILIRTANLQTLPHDINVHISKTMVPFGKTSAKLLLIAAGYLLISKAMETVSIQSFDWNRQLKALKRERNRKEAALETQIELLSKLEGYASFILSTAQDFERLADQVERLKLELHKPRKPNPESPSHETLKNGELFATKLKGRSKPPKTRAFKRPEF